MIKLFIILGLLTVSLGFPKSHLKTLFVHPREKQNLLSAGLLIVNGDQAQPHQFPYQVGIFVSKTSYTDFCGGSLISSNYVLTAAHCIDEAIKVTLVFGAHNITDTEITQVRLSSDNFIIHENWNGKIINENDIALIKLPSAVSETTSIKIVSIAQGSSTYAKETGAVAGWGLTRGTQVGITPVLRYITPSVMSNSDCKKVDKDYEAIVLDTLLCVSGSGNKGTCQGDSGGPLVVDGIQVGIVSFGATDCEAGKPSIFTRITEYNDWIVQNTDVKF